MTSFKAAGGRGGAFLRPPTRGRGFSILTITFLAAFATLSASEAAAEGQNMEDLVRARFDGVDADLESLWAVSAEQITRDSTRFKRWVMDSVPDLVPADVKCEKLKRCDKNGVCAIICKHGSVEMDEWLQRALYLQRKLAYRRNFCSATLPGTHNSAINLADGYGVEDHVYEGYLHYFSWFKKGMQVHTNDQLFSLTDQLQMGVRFIELDVHWFDGDLRIAHCGGFSSKLLDGLISVFNEIAKMLGTDIEWDSETIGCKPSLSSIPSSEQRSLKDALSELATWLHAPEHADEFLLVFFDDETNLMRWKKVDRLLEYLKTYFSEEEMLRPADLAYDTRWPAFQELIDAGKRVVFMSGADYLTSGQELLFVKETICDWQEPSLPLAPFPACVFNVSQLGPSDDIFTIFRPETSEIEYGFLNADGQIGSNKYLLDETSLPGMMACGVNLPSPDNITPKRMEATVWVVPKGHELDSKQCVALLREAKTWQSVDCQATNMVPACVDPENPHYWQIGETSVVETDAPAACAKLSPTVMEFSVPASGYENELVHRLLLEKAPASVAGVWLDAKALVSEVYSTEPEMTEEPEKKLYPIESVVSLE